jgi:hypothetical protein
MRFGHGLDARGGTATAGPAHGGATDTRAGVVRRRRQPSQAAFVGPRVRFSAGRVAGSDEGVIGHRGLSGRAGEQHRRSVLERLMLC